MARKPFPPKDIPAEERIKVGAHSRKRPAPKMPPMAPPSGFGGLAQAPGESNAPQPDEEDLEDGM